MARFYISNVGTFLYPWINTPDTKYKAEGLYHTDLKIADSKAAIDKERITAAAKQFFDEHTAEMKPGDAKKWELYLPFEAEEDDEGEPTGHTIFHFKQNAQIKTKKGDIKDIKIEIRDSKDNIISVPIFGGSEGRVMYTVRPIIMSQSKQAGVRLDFAKVQITKLVQGGATSQGFGEFEGGYEAQDAHEQSFPESDGTGGDY